MNRFTRYTQDMPLATATQSHRTEHRVLLRIFQSGRFQLRTLHSPSLREPVCDCISAAQLGRRRCRKGKVERRMRREGGKTDTAMLAHNCSGGDDGGGGAPRKRNVASGGARRPPPQTTTTRCSPTRPAGAACRMLAPTSKADSFPL